MQTDSSTIREASGRVTIGTLDVSSILYRFVADELLPGTGIAEAAFWSGAEDLIHEFAPVNRALLAERVRLQAALDDYHRSGGSLEPEEYQAFLRRIGYLVDAPDDVEVTTTGVDREIAAVAGPQLVVPVSNARYAVNAVNARWGSLYDALYGTDAIPLDGAMAPGAEYNPVRGAEVIRRARDFLDVAAPLTAGSHHQAVAYGVDDEGLLIDLGDGAIARLTGDSRFVGYEGDPRTPSAVVVEHHGLHVEIRVDRGHSIGAHDAAGVRDVLVEAAVTTIVDLEDSVAAVDVDDKVDSYRKWLGLMQGTLSARVDKNGRTFTRTMNEDRTLIAPGGETVTIPGRALMLVRNVGHLMTTDAIRDSEGREVPEGILDGLLSTLGGLHDIGGGSRLRNSNTGAIYVVKPKLHGPEEAAFTARLFDRIEALLGLPPSTVKVGLMDEERRTSVNLKACIQALSGRIAFINTGFLDRTGDEIRSSTHAGPMVRKAEMKSRRWFAAYEDTNVDLGIECDLPGRGQIGKGMWAAPDEMAAMLHEKVGHPRAGASCAWVPSPTAAVLHATHYHQVDVSAVQQQLRGRAPADQHAELTIPLASSIYSPHEIRAELENNLQGILGYVVRWVDQGIGCSKVPDIAGVQLMEDRATCRISAQHVANWMLHGVVSVDDVEAALDRMAAVVDEQNAGDPAYLPMHSNPESDALRAARELVMTATDQPNGYTEPSLHRWRIRHKQRDTP